MKEGQRRLASPSVHDGSRTGRILAQHYDYIAQVPGVRATGRGSEGQLSIETEQPLSADQQSLAEHAARLIFGVPVETFSVRKPKEERQ